jgi:MinD-like ATPase involved in chromosome partitioning or flagellar assembly
MKLRLLTAGGGATWEVALAQACQNGGAAAEVVQRCYDLADLLAAAAAGQAQVALIDEGTRWLDREAVAQLQGASVQVIGVAGTGDEDAERRLRMLGINHVARTTASPLELTELAAAAVQDDPPPGLADLGQGAGLGFDAGEPEQLPAANRLAVVWGPTGAPGRTTVAVNLAFEAASLDVETLLVDADTYGSAVTQTLGFLDDYEGLTATARLVSRGELDAPRLWGMTRRASTHGPRVLPGLPRPELWTELAPSTWDSMLELFKVTFPLTVVDVAFCLEEDEELSFDQVRFRRNAVTRLALQQADVVVAVARGDPVGLHHFIRAYHDLRELGIGADRIRVVVNQVREGMFSGNPFEEIRLAMGRYLGVEPLAFVPYDRAGLDAALHKGQALREAVRGAPAQRALARLARELFANHAAPHDRRRDPAASRRRRRLSRTGA